MKKFLSLFFGVILLAGLVSGAKAQTFEWVNTQVINYTLNPQMVRFTVTADPAGNVLQAGLLHYKANIAPGMAGDVMLRKYDRAGNLLFSQTLTGTAVVRHLVSCPNGDFLLAGAYRDSVVLSPGQKLAGNSTPQFFIARYSNAGQVLWLRNLSATVTGMQEITAVTVDRNGTLYAGFSGLNNLTFIKKFDAAGTELLHIQQNNVGELSGLGVDAAGNILATGSCIRAGATFGGQSFSNGGSVYNFYVVKYTPSGAPLWIRKVQDVTCIAPELKPGPQGSMYVAGVLNGSFTFGSHTTLGRTWSYDFFLTKLDSAGTFEWVREVPQVTAADADIGYSNYLETDSAGNAYLAGFMRNTINWGNGIVNTGFGAADFLVQKYNAAGTLLWSKNGGGTATDEGHSVAVNAFGEVYLAGLTRGAITLDTIYRNLSTTSVYHMLTKVAAPASISGIKDKPSARALQLYPNPASGSVTLVLPATERKTGQLTLLNATGQQLLQMDLQPTGTGLIPLELKQFPAGLYFVRVHHGSQVYHQRLMLK